ncbi:MFS transporter [Planctomyces sp. SH-PL62]|uniref:L-lactate MFS transporter n=1 Tax=Planctomyces sp. SH-PL62 TaxID=1636152 RepID=UPI00078C88BE|nr:MFS transporter [Planctomyces sp. SH-PL62]AMV40803.1 putative MFS-type transporter YhjX [Planctomyces sp. SH-PL62]
MESAAKVPAKAWVVTFAGMAVNLCLGILYAWSIWKANLVGDEAHPPGSPMSGLDAGWTYLTDAQATSAYAACGMIFALAMIPGGRIQDRYGPRFGATLGGLFLASGCILAGLMKSYLGLLLGFGVLGGIGMGFGYAAATPAAVKWFGPHRRGLVVGLVVGGYGAAAIYIAPLAKSLIAGYGLSGSFIGLGLLFALVVVVASRFLVFPPADYVPPGPAATTATTSARLTTVDWTAPEMLRTWQFYGLVFLFIGSAQSGLLVIANAAPLLNRTAGSIAFFVANAWLLASFGGLVNASGRVGTGVYSDRIGRSNAYLVNGVISAACLFLMPSIIASGSVTLLFLAVGVAYWQYGGALALMPAYTADFFGPKNLGFNYGFVFLGWGVAFFVPQAAGYLKDVTGSLDAAFFLSGGLLVAAVILSLVLKRPVLHHEAGPR